MEPIRRKRPQTFVNLLAFLALAAFLGLVMASSTLANQPSEPKRLTNVKGGDCVACHGQAQVMPEGHDDTKDMTYDDCLACHDGETTGSLRTKMPLGHLHHLQGVSCQDCHGDSGEYDYLETADCLACHESAEAVAKLTEGHAEENPHNSPHYGMDLDCELCHHAHEESENYCAQCHDWALVVP
jgi:hypothetical protein